LRGRRHLPAGPRVQPRLRGLPAECAALSAGRRRCARRPDSRSRGAGSRGNRLGAPRAGRERALRRHLGGARRCSGETVTGTVLHVGKVSGISGSEAHLLTLLPDLRRRGWDARFCLLHEGEPGAAEFAARLEAAEIPVERVRLRRDVDPVAFAQLRRVVRRTRPSLLHTHLVHADAYGLPAGKLARVPVLASTKHGFNSFRERRAFAVADRSLARLTDVHIAISAGLARYLADVEG